MKMAVWFSLHKKLVLAIMGLALMSACGSDTDEDLTAPTLTVDAVAPSTFTTARPLSGTVEDGAELDIAVSGDATVGADTDPAADSWKVTITDLAVGSNVVTVTADDSKGNTSSVQFILVRDLFIIDQADTLTSLTTSTVHGRLATGEETVTATLNGTAVDPGQVTGDAFRLELVGLADGNNTVTITAENAAGETQTKSLTIVSNAEAVSLTIEKPVIPLINNSLELKGTVADGWTADVSVKEPGEEVSQAIKGEDTDPATTSWTIPISNLMERDSIITVIAKQGEDIFSSSAWTRVVVYSLPTVVKTEVLPGTVLKATFSEALVASSVNATTFQVMDGTIEGKVAYSASDTSATFTPSAPLAPGDYSASINGVRDPDGNVIDDTLSFTIQ